MQSLVMALWLCAVIIAAAVAAAYQKPLRAHFFVVEGSETRKGKPKSSPTSRQISSPVFRNGSVVGYFVLRIGIVAQTDPHLGTHIKIEDVVVDEALNHLPSMTPEDVQSGMHPRTFATTVASGVNKRLGQKVIEDINITEFTFIAASEARR